MISKKLIKKFIKNNNYGTILNFFGSLTSKSNFIKYAITNNDEINMHILNDFTNVDEIKDKIIKYVFLDLDFYGDLYILLKFASSKLKNDEEFISKILEQSGMFLEFVDDKFKDDKNTVLKAVNKNGQSYKYCSERLKSDKEIFLIAYENFILHPLTRDDDYYNPAYYCDKKLLKDKDVKELIEKY